ncbi:hypothetical protein PY650_21190 [Rhizobium calliandrae]|uniref:Type II secretion system protein GspF domain-containing protein n=1 Tax=Rhizobium calliandrae TaxID=1312182 RepID=A0ABT7KHL1_9HYPH|nr:hypothetical protein [Rhizobium calliandrae]MDL2408121.1 hypothetical protein [Rhizobium calliandrae]
MSFQTLSEWVVKFGLKFAYQLRRRSRGNFADKWQEVGPTVEMLGVLQLHLRPALLAGVAIVQRAGPEMLSMLRGHLMGENKARLGNAIEEMVDYGRQSRTSSQLHLI